MSYAALAKLDLTCRPLNEWPGPRTPDTERQASRFGAPLTSTVELLARELDHLDAERIVLQLDVRESQLRIDGFPRSDARAASPGVVLSFESTHGPLRYACDRFIRPAWKSNSPDDWAHNLRAVALGLEHLRAVDRYGITKRGEQYRGWAELPAGIAQPATHMTAEDAAVFISIHAGPGMYGPIGVLNSRDSRDAAYRLAAKALHPDRGGDAALFQQLQAAKQLLDREA